MSSWWPPPENPAAQGGGLNPLVAVEQAVAGAG
jgi:hypothetical protein